jgi:drug/metabolite transporter (DMT)-like permease
MHGSPSAALAAALLFGAGAPAAKALLGGVGPTLLAGLLYLGSGITLGLARVALRPDAARFARRDWVWLASAILAGGIVAPILLLWGLTRTSASTASLLLVLEAPLTAVWARLLFAEHLGTRTVQAIGLMTVAGMLTIGPYGGAGDSLGLAAVALACAAWALDNNLTREVAHGDAVTVAALKGLVGGSVNVSAALLLGARVPRLGIVVAAGVVGAASYGLSLVLYVISLRGLGAARTAAYFAAAPFAGAIASVIVLGEPTTRRLAAAAALAALAVWRLLGERHRHRHRHQALQHFHVHGHDEHHRHAHAEGDVAGAHAHWHRHEAQEHDHPHAPDVHHRHGHRPGDGS